MNGHKARLVILALCLIATFSISYTVFQHFYYAKISRRIVRDKYQPNAIGKPLPIPKLVDFSGNTLIDDELRQGKVILILLSSECEACYKDGQFLKTVVEKYRNIRFYGALLFWSDQSVAHIENKFPMKLFFDQDSVLRQSLEVKSVPLKIFLEDGVVRKIWAGTPTNSQTEGEFIRNLEEFASK